MLYTRKTVLIVKNLINNKRQELFIVLKANEDEVMQF